MSRRNPSVIDAVTKYARRGPRTSVSSSQTLPQKTRIADTVAAMPSTKRLST
jgi:hypothetical protein